MNTSVPRSAFTIFRFAVTTFPPSASAPCPASGRLTIFTAFRLSPVSGSPNAAVKSPAVNVSAVSSAVLLSTAFAVGASFTDLTVTVAVAAAGDSAPDASVTLNVNVAVPCQSATGSNTSVPRSAAAIASPAPTAAGVVPDFSVPCALSGRLTTFTAFRLSPASGSLNAPSKLAAVNVSAVSSAVLTFSAFAAGASATALTVTVTVAAADSASDPSTTVNVNVAFPA